MKAYQGNEPYIFISYAHADSSRVLPILEALDAKGYRVWYDGGIAVGSEWPEYIAEHLNGCTAFICFISKTSLDSQNCRREINFAISKKKEPIVVYLEEVKLSLGMEMQLGTGQAIFRYKHPTLDSFLDALTDAEALSPCGPAKVKKVAPTPKPTPTPKVTPTPTPKVTPYGGFYSGGSNVTITNGSYTVSGNNTVIVNGQVISGGSTNTGDYTDQNGIKYRQSGYGESTVVGYSGNLYGQNLVIPASDPRGNRVTAIGSYAFQNAAMSSVTFPSSVATIESYAFYNCTFLQNIRFAKGLVSIGSYAFYNCTALPSVIFPEGLRYICAYAFYNCLSLQRVQFTGSRPAIDSYTFYNCPLPSYF